MSRTAGLPYHTRIRSREATIRRKLAIVGSLRRLDLRQHPSVTQTLEWAKTLLSLGAADLDAGLVADSLRTLLSYQSDIELASSQLSRGQLP